jgi:hypothetical protein
MVVAAESTRADAALPAGRSVASSSLLVSVECPCGCAGTVAYSSPHADISVERPVPRVPAGNSSAAAEVYTAAGASSSIEIAAVVKCVAL